jgi:hypothetical protein
MYDTSGVDPGTRFQGVVQGVVQGVFFLILTLGWTSPPAFDKLALWMLSLLLVRAGSCQ